MATLLKTVKAVIATQSSSRCAASAREDYCSLAFLDIALARAFIARLLAGPAPIGLNPLGAAVLCPYSGVCPTAPIVALASDPAQLPPSRTKR